MTADAVSYMVDAIRRLEARNAESASGSHAAGIFGRAANSFEKEIRVFVASMLQTCCLDYESEIRIAVKGGPQFHKLTLGNCVAAIEEASRRNRSAASACMPDGWEVREFVTTVRAVNDTWVQVKHGTEVSSAVQIGRLKLMVTVLEALNPTREAGQ